MVLSKKQYAILYSMYKDYIDSGTIKTFVAAKGVTSITMKSLLKTGFIETDRAIKGVPSNMRLSDKGIEAMSKHTKLERDTVDALIYRNKSKINLSHSAVQKVSALALFLKNPNVTITDIGYGIFTARIPGDREVYYEVYTIDEVMKIHPDWIANNKLPPITISEVKVK